MAGSSLTLLFAYIIACLSRNGVRAEPQCEVRGRLIPAPRVTLWSVLKRRLWFSATAIVQLLCLWHPVLRAQTRTPVNPHASPEARALLEFLYSISGHYTLTGQHNYPNTIATWTDRAYDFTGKYPAVFGQDFGFQGGEDRLHASAAGTGRGGHAPVS